MYSFINSNNNNIQLSTNNNNIQLSTNNNNNNNNNNNKPPIITVLMRFIGTMLSINYPLLLIFSRSLLIVTIILCDGNIFLPHQYQNYNHHIVVECRKHHLVLQYDFRRFFPISTFGYFPGGSLNINVTKFKFRPLVNSLEQSSVILIY